MIRRYWALQDFFLGYFYPDWHDEGQSRADIVRSFVQVAPPELLLSVRTDLRDLLAEPLSEKSLHDSVLNDYSLFYDPWRDEITMREWLAGLGRDMDVAASAQ